MEHSICTARLMGIVHWFAETFFKNTNVELYRRGGTKSALTIIIPCWRYIDNVGVNPTRTIQPHISHDLSDSNVHKKWAPRRTPVQKQFHIFIIMQHNRQPNCPLTFGGFFLFYMFFQNNVDILRKGSVIEFGFCAKLFKKIAVNCYADFFF